MPLPRSRSPTRRPAAEGAAAPRGGVALDPIAAEHPIDPALERHLASSVRSEALRAAARRLLARSRPHAYCSAERPLAVLVGTYNVNGREPPSGIDLRPWLTGSGRGKEKLEKLPDIVAVTFQEVVPLSAANVLLSAASGGEAWEGAVADALEKLAAAEEEGEGNVSASASSLPGGGGGGGGNQPPPFFTPVARRQMVGVSLLVFARTSLVASGLVRGAQTLAVGTGGALPSVVGVGGSSGGNGSDPPSTSSSSSPPSLGLGNKGAVAARLLIHSATPLVFIGAHLPSGDSPGDAARRDAAAAEVLRRGFFPADATAEAGRVVVVSDNIDKEGSEEASSSSSSSSYWPSGRCQLSAAVADADVSFFAGDLNYRVLARADAARRALRSFRARNSSSSSPSSSSSAAPTTSPSSSSSSSSSPLATLLALDELRGAAAKARGACPFSSADFWEEGEIGFAPTYKLERFSRKYQGEDGGDDHDGDDDGDDDDGDGQGGGGGGGDGDGSDAEKKKKGSSSKEKEKTRTPSWTDRVLYRNHPSSSTSNSSSPPPPPLAKLLWYASAPGVLGSDHRPVAALFEVAARRIDPAALSKALDDASRAADAAETRRPPRCCVVAPPKGTAVDFGTLRRGSAPTAARSFVLRNNATPSSGEGSGAGGGLGSRGGGGGGVARWSLAPLPGRVFCDGGDPERARLAPLWLAVSPVGGELLPGESAVVRCVASPFGACSAAAAAGAGASPALEEEEEATMAATMAAGGGGGGAAGDATTAFESDFGARGSLAARPPRVAADAIAAAAAAAAAASKATTRKKKRNKAASAAATEATDLSGDNDSDGESESESSNNSFPLEAVVVVRVEGGNDEFVSFKGSIEASWWGLGLERLSGMPRPLSSSSSSQNAPVAVAAAPAPAPAAAPAAPAAAAAAEEEELPPLQPPATLAPLRTSSDVVAAPATAAEANAAAAASDDGRSDDSGVSDGGGVDVGPNYSSGGEFYSPASSLASNCSSVAGGGGGGGGGVGGPGNPGSASGSPLSASGLSAGAAAAAAAFPRGGSRLGPNGGAAAAAGGERQQNGTPLSPPPPSQDEVFLQQQQQRQQQRSPSPLPPTPKAIPAGEKEKEEESAAAAAAAAAAAKKPPSPLPPPPLPSPPQLPPLPPPRTPSTPMPLLVPPELERLISFLDDSLEAAAGKEGKEGEEGKARVVTPSLFVHAAGRARRAALSGAVAAEESFSSFSSSSSSAPGGECLDDVDALRSLLDSQQPLPARCDSVHPAAAAAALLAFLLLLPRPLLPARAAALCDGAGRAPAPDAAGDLLRNAMGPAEWATLGAVAGLASRVVEREGRARSRGGSGGAESSAAVVAGSSSFFFPSARTPLPALLAEFLLPAALAPCSSSSSSAAAAAPAAQAAAAATAAAGGVVVASSATAANDALPLSLSSLALSCSRDGAAAGAPPRRFSASGGGLASPELAAAAAAALAAVADAADAAASARAELVATVIDRAREWWPPGE